MDEVKSHPWLQGAPDSSGHAYALNEPPFLLSTLGDKFRYLGFGSHGSSHANYSENVQTARMAANTFSPFAPYPLDIFLPKRGALRKLPGHHPNPVIVSLLKRDPFAAVDISNPSNINQIIYSNAEGGALSSLNGVPSANSYNSLQRRRNIYLKEPTTFGFSTGFGYKPEEVDEVIKKAMKSNTYYEHSIIAIYYLLHEWMQKHAGKPVFSGKESDRGVPSISLPSLIQQHHMETRPNSEIPPFDKRKTFDSIYPRQISEKSMLAKDAGVKALIGLKSSKSPQELYDQFFVIMIEEGFIHASNGSEVLPSGKDFANGKNSAFLSEWIWRPSLIVPSADEKLFRVVQFQIEWLQILTNEKVKGMATYGIRCMRKSGDADLFDKVWERVQWRWTQWLQHV
jgi:hypothetical protein